ncbi:cytochrome P450 9e2-like [Ceratina calcarata]|uniref:Cytochrome P450 9e2-like n=1 Tax=Ceratina calcarata TaxID=156304 RepID=A0AAJ7N814_9HYME|nr:cytochrome P450 9e2-like [Ceratina calcarata]
MDLWSVILAGSAIILLYYYLKRKDKFAKHGIPCNKTIPFVGNLWKVIFSRCTVFEMVDELYKAHKEAKYIGGYEFLSPMIAIRDLELIKTITVKNFDHFTDHRGMRNNANDPLFTQNLFFLKGERWKEVRNVLSPIFTSSKLKGMFVLMSECAKRFGETLASLPTDQRTVELKDAFTRYTNDVIATCAFGIEVDSMKDRKNTFYVYGREATDLSGWMIMKFLLSSYLPRLAKLLNMKVVHPKIENYFINLVENNIKQREEKGINRQDMIQLLMESKDKLGPGKELSIIDITAQAFVFFFAGFESTATLMCFSAYEIGVNPDVQKKVQEEIDQVLIACNGEVTYEALMGMKYLDAVINESLRMYPVQPTIDRVCTEKFELPPTLPGAKPYIMEKGDSLVVPVYGILHDEKYFEDPEEFKPERFLNDGKKEANATTYFPFGLGPRICIGNRFALLETKVLLFHIFAKCNLIICPKTTYPMVLNKKTLGIMPVNGFYFEVQPREK